VLHTAPDVLEPLPGVPVIAGVDFGLGGSACVFLQRDARGRYLLVHELVGEELGVESFGNLLSMECREAFPENEVTVWCDPAGNQRSQLDERTAIQLFKSMGIPAKPARTNDLITRLESVRRPLSRLIDARPGLVVCPTCVHIRRALGGGYHYRRLRVSGGERFHDLPEKDEHSHVADALQYALLGAGEGQPLKRPGARRYEYSIM
jgi:hypothetical protein